MFGEILKLSKKPSQTYKSSRTLFNLMEFFSQFLSASCQSQIAVRFLAVKISSGNISAYINHFVKVGRVFARKLQVKLSPTICSSQSPFAFTWETNVSVIVGDI